MTVTYLNLFTDQDLSYDWKDAPYRYQGNIIVVDWPKWQMIHLHPISKLSDTLSFALVHTTNHDDLMASFDEVRSKLE